MVEEALVSFPREAGWKLLEKMDAAKLDVTVAYWRYVEEDEEWQLFLATPLVPTKGPLYVIGEIQRLLKEMPDEERGDLALRDIAVISPQLKEVDALRSYYGTITENRGKRVRLSVSRKEPFIYRLT